MRFFRIKPLNKDENKMPLYSIRLRDIQPTREISERQLATCTGDIGLVDEEGYICGFCRLKAGVLNGPFVKFAKKGDGKEGYLDFHQQAGHYKDGKKEGFWTIAHRIQPEWYEKVSKKEGDLFVTCCIMFRKGRAASTPKMRIGLPGVYYEWHLDRDMQDLLDSYSGRKIIARKKAQKLRMQNTR